MQTQETTGERVSTGVEGVDSILHGGFIPERTYMVRGDPGTGKSLLGLHFLLNGAENGEEVLYINPEESAANIRQNAASFGFDVEDLEFLDLSPDSEFFSKDLSYDIFSPDEVEQESLTAEIADRVETLTPDRVFVDPLTQLRYLAPDDYQFRKQVLSFMDFLHGEGATVLFTSQDTTPQPDDDLQFMSDGTITLTRHLRERLLEVTKFRGSNFEDGRHSFRIRHGGLHVFPDLIPRQHGREFANETIPSGVPELDQLLYGGLERGTATIITGPTGVGKTTTGVQFMKEAAGRGERSVVYTFEEGRETLIHRCESINMPIREMLDRGTLRIEEIEPLELSADEFAYRVRREIEDHDTEIVMLDGIVGYRLSVHGDRDDLTREIHKLGKYMKNMGATLLLINETNSIAADFEVTDDGVSYLADNILFLRHLEIGGEMRKAIGVLKKRTSDFERSVREFELDEYGIRIGEPMTDLRGILNGTPEWVDEPNELLRDGGSESES
ncbi:ATPase domain-containing protein [Halalkalicoccus jeotgali]|uniref:non-specific serine/threonine protein kinase n=1 Tax=Halalkalicoccus jeotgali (strain DSM 18796 / CECT 7217 / JCM 14584 / KCTC 4019 / B3) TaxID=795797 RepID=D8J8V6_HALJB|nr:ATPase domain-containing protein [Halalkalicoccus jeotgali]ADJ14291.1 putative circadian clock protein, KaiC [Halalkalicoccus jeotgali B3]ELY40553.1 putative circadian clock protein, KaiC [Halalkalicoccus jeotgali B3]